MRQRLRNDIAFGNIREGILNNYAKSSNRKKRHHVRIFR
jgi:hypothetical protein